MLQKGKRFVLLLFIIVAVCAPWAQASVLSSYFSYFKESYAEKTEKEGYTYYLWKDVSKKEYAAFLSHLEKNGYSYATLANGNQYVYTSVFHSESSEGFLIAYSQKEKNLCCIYESGQQADTEITHSHPTPTSTPANLNYKCSSCQDTGDCSYCDFGACNHCWGNGERECSCVLGDCPTCLGRGYHSVYTIQGIIDRNCSACNNTGIHSYCKGSGSLSCNYCSGSGACFACQGTGNCSLCQ